MNAEMARSFAGQSLYQFAIFSLTVSRMRWWFINEEILICVLCGLCGLGESLYSEIISLACAKEISHQDHKEHQVHKEVSAASTRAPLLSITTKDSSSSVVIEWMKDIHCLSMCVKDLTDRGLDWVKIGSQLGREITIDSGQSA